MKALAQPAKVAGRRGRAGLRVLSRVRPRRPTGAAAEGVTGAMRGGRLAPPDAFGADRFANRRAGQSNREENLSGSPGKPRATRAARGDGSRPPGGRSRGSLKDARPVSRATA